MSCRHTESDVSVYFTALCSAPCRRHRNRCKDIRNAGSAAEIRLVQGSQLEGKCDENNLNIVTNHVFSESSRSASLKCEGYSRGTPTMLAEINDFERVGGLPVG